MCDGFMVLYPSLHRSLYATTEGDHCYPYHHTSDLHIPVRPPWT